uniref:ATP synthase F0 subunit 8 n=1 Tax=Eurytoma sp. ZJUH_2016013 TaxID=2491157 RepID=A0A3S8V0P9_9HYME|nr:ATP synthase F0 subunit 8 [Eurytoma sp. ZJUH_2016013]
MPQMSPMNWLILYIYLLVILMLMNVILNFLFISIIKFKKFKIYSKKKFLWVW